MLQIRQTSDLEDHLGISADASAGVGLSSASDRFSFSRDCKIQANSISLLLTCTQQNGFVQITEPILDEAASAVVSNGQSDLFSQRYGDRFVAGLESGGQFFGVIRIEVRSETDHQTIENSLSGSYGPFSADVSVKVQSALTQTNSSAETLIYYEGGNVQTKPRLLSNSLPLRMNGRKACWRRRRHTPLCCSRGRSQMDPTLPTLPI